MARPVLRQRLRHALAGIVWAATMSAVSFSHASDNAAAPQIAAEFLDGQPYSLSTSKGSVTLVSVWSPESLASRKSIGELQRFASAYHARVNTLAVSTLKDADALRAFVAKRALTVPVAILADHNLGALPERHLPLVYVFDHDGKLRASSRGMFAVRHLERMVEPLLPH